MAETQRSHAQHYIRTDSMSLACCIVATHFKTSIPYSRWYREANPFGNAHCMILVLCMIYSELSFYTIVQCFIFLYNHVVLYSYVVLYLHLHVGGFPDHWPFG